MRVYSKIPKEGFIILGAMEVHMQRRTHFRQDNPGKDS